MEGYSIQGYTREGLQRLQNTSGELRGSWRQDGIKVEIPDDVERKQRPTCITHRTKYTDEFKQKVRDLKAGGMKTKQIAERYGMSYKQVEHLLYDKPVIMARKMRVKLTEEQIEWIKSNYANTKNDAIQVALGIGRGVLYGIVHRYGLKKSRAFMAEMAQYASEKAKESHILHGTYPKKGTTRWQEMSEEKRKEARRKAGETRRRIIQDEKRRILYGLEQKTNINVLAMSKQKSTLRSNMASVNKYIRVPHKTDVIYYDENTKRSKIREQRALEMGMEVKPYGE